MFQRYSIPLTLALCGGVLVYAAKAEWLSLYVL